MVRVDPSGMLITLVLASFFCMLLVLVSDRIASFSLRDLSAQIRETQEIALSAKTIAKDAAELAIEAAGSSCGSSGMEEDGEDDKGLAAKAEALSEKIK